MQVVQQPSSTWTIIQDVGIYAEYPRTALGPEVARLFDTLSTNFPKNLREKALRLQTLLECYLQITSQSLSLQKLYEESFIVIARGFIGALHCENFVLASKYSRYDYLLAFRRLIVECARDTAIAYIPEVPTTVDFLSWEDGTCIKQFRNMQLHPDRVWVWKAWKVKNLNGDSSWLRLEPLTHRFDREFVQAFFEVCETCYSTGRGGNANYMNRMARFTAEYPGATRHNLLGEEYATSFWHSFYNFYLNEELKGSKVATIVTTWYREVKTFAEKHLFPSGLFGKPLVFPTPPRRPVIGSTLHLGIGENGKLHVEKLLTYIPIQLSHREAIDILFHRLKRDVDLILKWANCEAAAIWNAYSQRIVWEKQGIVRKLLKPGGSNKISHLSDRENPDHLKNAATTIAKHYGGYGTRESYPSMLQVLPVGLPKLARELGFPVTNSLLPHMAILVHEHPEITPAFLEKLELFDSHGKLIGLVSEDFGYTLISVKMRRGRQLAEQQIALSQRAAEIVFQVIAITAAPRQYLKDKNDKQWRYLFLTTGKAFGNPTRVTKINTCTSDPGRIETLGAQLSVHNNIVPTEAADLAFRFSLPALRASMGVLEYIETCSGPKMAAKLGHAEYNERLLSRYLPAAIKAFLQTRYIRIMQTGIIVEAMKGSPHMLNAASFSTVEELNAFLTNHAICFSSNRPPEHLLQLDSNIESDGAIEKIIFEINIDVLIIYASLEKAFLKNANLANPAARYWNDIGIRLMSFIEEKKNSEPKQMAILIEARSKADCNYVSGFFHEE